MKKKRIAVAAISLSVLLLTGCECKHEWVEADCYKAKTCSKCEITEGEPLEHSPGEWEEMNDIIQAKFRLERKCSECGILLNSTSGNINSLSNGSQFIFSPREFVDRLAYFAELALADFRYEIQEGIDGKSMNVLLYFEGSTGNDYMISFCNKSGEVLTTEDLDAEGVWYVALSSGTHIDSQGLDKYGIILDPDLMLCFYMACDPTFSAEDYQQQQLRHLTCYLNWIEYGEMMGYFEVNELLYEFFFGGMLDDKGDYYVQQIGVYPVNFMK